MITVDTYKMLKALPNHTEGEIAYVTKEEQKYQYTEEKGWQVYKAPAVAEMSLYDLNKQIISQMPDIEDFTEAYETIDNYHKDMKNKYYMLLIKDLSYYTIFSIGEDQSAPRFSENVVLCLKDWGPVKSITMSEDNSAVECWVTTYDNNTVVGYLFAYDGGVLECR